MFIAEPYEVTTPPAITPVSVDEFRGWAKVTSVADNGIIQRILEAVTLEAEKYTKRDFINREYRTLRDVFGDVAETPVADYGGGYPYLPNRTPITIRRTPLQSIDAILYEKDGATIALDLGDVRIEQKDAFSKVHPIQSTSWPIADPVPQAIEIQFTAGYGESETDVPADLRQAILIHATSIYQDRGDCDPGGACSCAFAPGAALAVYNQYRIMDFRA